MTSDEVLTRVTELLQRRETTHLVQPPDQEETPRSCRLYGLGQKIPRPKGRLEAERKQATGPFAELKGSLQSLADYGAEEARQLLDRCWSA